MKIKIIANKGQLNDIYITDECAKEMLGNVFTVEKIYRNLDGLIEHYVRLSSGGLYYVLPEHFKIVEPPKRIKITATVDQLITSRIPESEAERLSGSVQKVVEFEDDRYGVKMVPGTGTPLKNLWWIRPEYTMPILEEEKESDEAAEEPTLDLSKPVQTRDGRKAKVVFVGDDWVVFPVVGVVEGCTTYNTWTKLGVFQTNMKCANDLVNVPEKPEPKYTHFFVPNTRATLDALLKYSVTEEVAKESLGKTFPIKYLNAGAVFPIGGKYYFPLNAVELCSDRTSL